MVLLTANASFAATVPGVSPISATTLTTCEYTPVWYRNVGFTAAPMRNTCVRTPPARVSLTGSIEAVPGLGQLTDSGAGCGSGTGIGSGVSSGSGSGTGAGCGSGIGAGSGGACTGGRGESKKALTSTAMILMGLPSSGIWKYLISPLLLICSLWMMTLCCIILLFQRPGKPIPCSLRIAAAGQVYRGILF